MNDQQMKNRFHELLPWHVNGTLADRDREWVEQYLQAHPEVRAESRWYESLQIRMRENAPVVSDEIGWEKFSSRIQQERRATTKPTCTTPSLMQRVREFLASFRLTPAFAATAAVIVIQGGVIGTLMVQQAKQDGGDDYATVRSMPRPFALQGPLFQINFKPDSSERDIRMLLVSVEGTLVGGPGQIGDYVVSVPAEKIKAAEEKLRASSSVESVSILATLPAKGQ